MRINDVPVTYLAKLGTVGVAVGDGINNAPTTPHYFSPNSDGQYVIEIKIKEPKGMVRITSFVLY